MRLTLLALIVALVLAPALGAQSAEGPGYILRPGDIVRLSVYGERDLSHEYEVDPRGRVDFPLVGSFMVAGETRESLRAKLFAAYNARVEDLSMGVVVLRRLPVVGAVRNPGLHPVDLGMTVAEAVALAGGSTMDPRRTRISLLRRGTVAQDTIDPSTRMGDLEMQPGDQLFVPSPQGFFARNPWAAGTIIQSLVTIVTIIATR
jgi:protein involved in polysaccharide export with SLBB domain